MSDIIPLIAIWAPLAVAAGAIADFHLDERPGHLAMALLIGVFWPLAFVIVGVWGLVRGLFAVAHSVEDWRDDRRARRASRVKIPRARTVR